MELAHNAFTVCTGTTLHLSTSDHKHSWALQLSLSHFSQVHALVINLCNIHFMYIIRVWALHCKQKKLLAFHPYLYIFPSQVPQRPWLCRKAGQTPRGRDVN